MNKIMLATAAGVLVAGGAVAAYTFSTPYADVISSTPITEKEPVFANVVGADAVTETVTGTREECADVAVEKRRPERFGNTDGAVVGAVVGGLIGSQVGGGNGRKVATVAGAVGGGFAGREIDRRHEGGERYTEMERQCHTVSEPREQVIGYDVRYQLDGQSGITRVADKPGAQIQIGERDRIVGYEVKWQYKDQTGTLMMDQDPGKRLPIENGTVAVSGRSEPAPAQTQPQGG